MGVSFAVSPDGRRIVFTGGAGGALSLWVWSAEDGQARRLEDTAGGVSPFFSPDGREVAFFAGDDLKRAPVDGGPATTIAAVPLASVGTWSRDGTILLTRPVGADAGLYRVPARGGEVQPVVSTPSLREQRAFPRFLPDGRSYLFLRGFGRPVTDRRLCVASLDDQEPDCFTTCHSQADYSASGHVLCVRAGTLVALPFDARTRKPTGEAVTVARDVRWFGPSGSASFAVSADGRALAYEPRPAVSRLAWLDRAGRQTATIGEPGTLGLLQISPDGRRIAADIWHPDGHGRDLWAFETASGVASRLTFSPIDAWAPAWAPDGKRLAYGNAEDGPPDVTVLHLDGSGRQEVVLRAPGVQSPRHWSPDGRLILYENASVGRRDQRQLWYLSLDGKNRRVTATPFSSYHGRFSPDGRRLAYVSEESGGPEVYVAPVEGGPARRISRAGGLLPRWRGDGAELFFVQPDGLVMAVPCGRPGRGPAVPLSPAGRRRHRLRLRRGARRAALPGPADPGARGRRGPAGFPRVVAAPRPGGRRGRADADESALVMADGPKDEGGPAMRRKAGLAAKPYDTYAYWLMPHGLRGLLTTVFWPAARSRRSDPGRSESPRLGDQPAGARGRYPGPRRPFPILAPGKVGGGARGKAGTEMGEHTFWRGSLWGRTVALQGDSSFHEVRSLRGRFLAAPLLGHVPGQRLLRQRREPQLLGAVRLDGPVDERG